MPLLREVRIEPRSLDVYAPLLGEAAMGALREAARTLERRARRRIVWNVSSTAVGGGVAEMLRSLVGYAQGAGVDTRWLVLGGTSDFFRITKRLHNALHGERGDGSLLGAAERRIYETVLRQNADELLARTRPDDIVLLHDPQTAGLAPLLLQTGARVVWRCHIGTDETNGETQLGWSFLAPYLEDVPLVVFSRQAYVPAGFESRAAIVAPSIDPFSPKNEPLEPRTVHAILSFVGLVHPALRPHPPAYQTSGGERRTVRHCADVLRLGPAPGWHTPLVVQASRWDVLKDPVGVMLGFARLVQEGRHEGARMILAGPNVHAVADDPDGARVYAEVVDRWRLLPHEVRRRVDLVSLPTHDVAENAVVVNALQRHAAVVVQKSVKEGFGLSVTEAMWKGRPVVASAKGGIQDQIVDEESGLLVHDPANLGEFASALGRVLADPALARRLGANAHERVKAHFLDPRSLRQYAALIERLEAGPAGG